MRALWWAQRDVTNFRSLGSNRMILPEDWQAQKKIVHKGGLCMNEREGTYVA